MSQSSGDWGWGTRFQGASVTWVAQWCWWLAGTSPQGSLRVLTTWWLAFPARVIREGTRGSLHVFLDLRRHTLCFCNILLVI